MTESLDRRSFLTSTVAAGLGIALATTQSGLAAPLTTPAPAQPLKAQPMERVRIGIIGVGGRGMSHVGNLLKLDKVEITAICDIVEDKVKAAQARVVKAGQKEPAGFSKGEHDYKNLCQRPDVDLVLIATPWEWHVPMCVEAMHNGKHAATEVPAALTVDECWQLVETSEKTKLHCVMLENCNYGRAEMLALNLVRKGMLGEIVHAEGGYLHDLRGIKFSGQGEGLWRTAHAIKRNGNLYPTHGLGPVANCLNINRGDQFDFMVSMSSKSRGLNVYCAEKFGKDDPRAKQTYKLGDVNCTLIRTKSGATFLVEHDCDNPRPYSRIHNLQGTKGIINGYPDRVYIEGRDPNDTWVDMEKYYDEFDHPLWKKEGSNAKGSGHGGMDYLLVYRLVECLLKGEPTDMSVYDAAALSVISPLSEWSVANKSKPIDVPDFTRGQWKNTPPWGVVEG